MLDIAEATGDADLLIRGHRLACIAATVLQASSPRPWSTPTRCWTSTTTRSIAILQTSSTTIPKLRPVSIGSVCTWILGYPDRALRLSNEKDAHARRRGHPFDLGYALTIGAHEFDHRYELEDLRKRAEECERLGRENSLPVMWAMLAPVSYGQALIREGKPAEGIAPLKAGIAVWEASGGKARIPTMNAFLAEGMALTGDLDNALQLIDELIDQIERPGWEERLSLRRDPAPQGLDALAQGRSRRRRAELSRLARLGAPPTGENVGVAHLDQPRTAVAEPRQTPGRV